MNQHGGKASLQRSLVLLFLLALGPLWLSMVAAPALRVDVGVWGDHALLSGVNGIELPSSETYRWTTGYAELAMPNLSPGYRLLALRAHGWRPAGLPPPLVQLDLGGQPWGTMQTSSGMRVYRVLLPPDPWSATRHVGFSSATYQPPGDPRSIGFGIDYVTLGAAAGWRWPAVVQAGAQALLLATLLALVALLSLGPAPTLLLAVLVATVLPWANAREPLWLALAVLTLLLLAAGLLLCTLLLRPRLAALLAPWASARQARIAWALLVGALALRLAGSLHPLFDAHDLGVHTRWLGIVATGELYLYSTPAELRNQQTFNPPAAYLLLLPLELLLPADRLVVQGGVALIDALGCLLLLPLARELGLRPRVGLLAMALASALPISTTILWWGFATNTVAQTLWLALLWALLRASRRPTPLLTACCAVLLALCLTTHAGALVLVVAMLALLLPLSWPRLSRPARRSLLLAVGSALLVVVPVYFVAAAGPVLAQEVDPQKRSLAATLAKGWADRELRLALVRRGWLLGYTAPLLALAALGMPLLWSVRRRHALLPALLLVWLASCAVFFATYMSLGLLTRYIYFAAPLVCLAAAALLSRLWQRPAGRAVVVATVLLVALTGATLWSEGVLLRVKPSVVPLSH